MKKKLISAIALAMALFVAAPAAVFAEPAEAISAEQISDEINWYEEWEWLFAIPGVDRLVTLTPGAQEIALEDFDYLVNMIFEVAPTQNIISRRLDMPAEEFFNTIRNFIQFGIPIPSLTFVQMSDGVEESDYRWLYAQTDDLYIAADYLMSLLTLMSIDLQTIGHIGPQPRFLVQNVFDAWSFAYHTGPTLYELEEYVTALVAEQLAVAYYFGIVLTDEEIEAIIQAGILELDSAIRFTAFQYATFTPAVRWFYNLSEEQPDPDDEPPVMGFFDENNVVTDIIVPGEIAYIRINSFLGNPSFDAETLFPFYQYIQGFDHLIIDLTGNGGGWLVYFPFNVLAMLIDEPISFQYVEFFMANELTEALFVNPISAAVIGTLYNIVPAAEFLQNNPMPYFNAADAQLLDYAIIWQVDLDPSPLATPFGGEIWLLVDGGSASASEMAALISASTGFATVVGQPTAGVTGVVYTFAALPNTGIHVRIDLGYTVDQYGRSIEEFGFIPEIASKPMMTALETVLALLDRLPVVDLDTAIALNGEIVADGIIIEGRTMVSVAEIASMFGAGHLIFGTQVLFVYGEEVILFTRDAELMLVNGELALMHAPAQLINGELFLPIRSVAEALGYEIDFIDYVVVITAAQE